MCHHTRYIEFRAAIRRKETTVSKEVNRRNFVGAVSAAAALSAQNAHAATGEAALLGGKPVRTEPFPSWPVADEREDNALVEVVRSRKWGRGNGSRVDQFESAYA